jgi:hypothetical protein
MPTVASQKLKQFRSLVLARRLIHDVFLVLMRVVVVVIPANDFHIERRNVVLLMSRSYPNN